MKKNKREMPVTIMTGLDLSQSKGTVKLIHAFTNLDELERLEIRNHSIDQYFADEKLKHILICFYKDTYGNNRKRTAAMSIYEESTEFVMACRDEMCRTLGMKNFKTFNEETTDYWDKGGVPTKVTKNGMIREDIDE